MTSNLKNQSNAAVEHHDAQALIAKQPGSARTKSQAREYETPVLIAYGDVRDITLGPTLGTTESGCAGVFRPGSGLPPGTPCPPGGN